MSTYLIDTHCHLHDAEFYSPAQAAELLDAAHANQVRQIIVIGTDLDDSAAAATFAAAHKDVFWTYGIHPEYANSHSAADLAALSLRPPEPRDRLVAIGEIGLDYHYESYDRPAQIRLFEMMLQCAQDLSLPVSLHIREREAFADAWPILDNFPDLTGVVHSFTGSKQELRRALSRNFYIGVNGLATYSTLPLPPLKKMLLETDAPFLTPAPFRGTINTPGYVRNVAAYLSGKLGVAEETIVEQTTKNARQLFHI